MIAGFYNFGLDACWELYNLPGCFMLSTRHWDSLPSSPAKTRVRGETSVSIVGLQLLSCSRNGQVSWPDHILQKFPEGPLSFKLSFLVSCSWSGSVDWLDMFSTSCSVIAFPTHGKQHKDSTTQAACGQEGWLCDGICEFPCRAGYQRQPELRSSRQRVLRFFNRARAKLVFKAFLSGWLPMKDFGRVELGVSQWFGQHLRTMVLFRWTLKGLWILPCSLPLQSLPIGDSGKGFSCGLILLFEKPAVKFLL